MFSLKLIALAQMSLAQDGGLSSLDKDCKYSADDQTKVNAQRKCFIECLKTISVKDKCEILGKMDKCNDKCGCAHFEFCKDEQKAKLLDAVKKGQDQAKKICPDITYAMCHAAPLAGLCGLMVAALMM